MDNSLFIVNYSLFMKIVLQRVKNCSISINSEVKSKIQQGILIFTGFENSDTIEDIEWMSGKIVRLRIFNDSNNIMNLSVADIDGEIMLVSQFTLHASTKKGNRPSYIKSAKPEIAIPLYKKFIHQLSADLKKEIRTGEFGADMQINLINNGPVTITIDSKNKV